MDFVESPELAAGFKVVRTSPNSDFVSEKVNSGVGMANSGRVSNVRVSVIPSLPVMTLVLSVI